MLAGKKYCITDAWVITPTLSHKIVFQRRTSVQRIRKRKMLLLANPSQIIFFFQLVPGISPATCTSWCMPQASFERNVLLLDISHKSDLSNMIFSNPSGAWYTKSLKLTSIIAPSSTAMNKIRPLPEAKTKAFQTWTTVIASISSLWIQYYQDVFKVVRQWWQQNGGRFV